MRRTCFTLALVVLLASGCFAQAPGDFVKVKIRAALFDRDLNLKPVPRMAITLRALDAPQQAPLLAQTTLDGIAEVELKAGRYQLTTEKPIELVGKSYLWTLEVNLVKPENVIELSNDNAKVTDVTGGRGARVDELAQQFQRVKNSVVTVWAEDYAFDGTLIDPAGLVLTSNTMIDGHDWFAVQFDDTHKLPAVVLAQDKTKDVAILRVNLTGLPESVVAQLTPDPSALVEGERVFTVQNSVYEGKMLLSGVVSRADTDLIASDVKLSDVGGPLFSSTGGVVGFIRVSGEKLAVAPIGTALSALTAANDKLKIVEAPSARLLPCHPKDYYPADALRSRGATKWEKEIYYFKLGDFEVHLHTPVSLYEAYQEEYLQKVKERDKVVKKGKAPPPITEPEHKYRPVLAIRMTPGVKMAFWKSFGDSMLTNGQSADTYRYKTTFLRLRLMCGNKEVEPIWRGRAPVGEQRGWSRVVEGSSYQGRYEYPYDAISPACGQVSLEISSTKDAAPLVKVLDPALVKRLADDFAAYHPPQPSAAAK